MRTIRACITNAETAGQTIELPDSVFQHLVKVLRLGEHAEINIFNSRGARFKGKLVNVAKKRANIELVEELTAQKESPLQTHMGLVMSKGDRFDYALQKATELGLNSITPLVSEHCDLKLNPERLEKKFQHWQGVLVSACEQCYRDVVPTLNPIQPLAGWAEQQTSAVKLVLHTAAREPAWPEQSPADVSFVIGPEGGLTEGEVEFLQTKEFQAWQLGPRILRTETAPVVLLSLLQSKWGDF